MDMARLVILAGAMLSFLSKAVCIVRLPFSINTRYHLPVRKGRGMGGEGEEVGKWKERGRGKGKGRRGGRDGKGGEEVEGQVDTDRVEREGERESG